MERIEKLEAVADIISRIFHYGSFEIETPNERILAGLLNDLGYFPTTEEDIIKRRDWEELFLKYREYKL